jgi:hypothetical protein
MTIRRPNTALLLFLAVWFQVLTITTSWTTENPSSRISLASTRKQRQAAIPRSHKTFRNQRSSYYLFSTTSSSDSDSKKDKKQQLDLLEKSRLLREQAKALEEDLRFTKQRSDNESIVTNQHQEQPIQYTK